jgi:hypothetical protein
MQRRRPPPFQATLPVHPFHDRGQRKLFLRLVREHLGRGGRQVVIHDGCATVEGEPGYHGLGNLAQMCFQAPAVRWPEIIARHLDLSSPERMEALAADLVGGTLDGIAEHLAVRLYPGDYLADGLRAHVVHRTDLPGTLTLLVFDAPDSVVAVPAPLAEEWGQSRERLFELAVGNITRLSTARWQRLPFPPGVGAPVHALTGDHYVTSRLLLPDPGFPRAGASGNLVAIPHRGALLSMPIDGAVAPFAIEALLTFSIGMFHDGPGSITPHLFWRTPAGSYELQQGSRDGTRYRLAPTPGFATLLGQGEGTGSA